MAVYEYVGLDGAGKAIKGVIDADTPRAARTRLRKQGTFPTEVREQKAGAMRGQGFNVEIDFSKYFQRVTVQELATLTSQLSTLVAAAIPMVEALGALIDQSENPKLKAILTDVREKVNEGSSLARALRAHPEIFSDLFVNMVDAGEHSGALDVVLQRLTTYTESAVALRGKLIAALTYPILMMGVSTALVLGLFGFVVPKLKRIFDSFDTTLPLITRVIFGLSNAITGYWWLLLMIAAAVAYGLRRWLRTDSGRRWLHKQMLRMPIFGPLNRRVAVSRFCRTLGTLLTSGVPILTALGIVKTVVDNVVIAEAVEAAGRNIAEGQSIAVPLRASGEFPPSSPT